MFFFVGEEERPVPTHKIILQASGKFRLCSSDDESDEDVIQLQDVACPILHALLQYDLKFREAGGGCVAFDAFACNDVTVVFRENVRSQHYHLKRDNSPHYTVIIGSHRNRRLKIEVDGKTVVDEAGLGLCCS
ncbi:hypothetical protein SLEP1_g11187 [Rubroshorea leprosula]|uniref:Farnesoic acid O-methyl transferase domain-containing protein n=1 Tax=Rubroshorea leprosula TaxID=152421 RepID=A0AAV5IKB8_9ROSI|nr:hypothetical protein SLEP1_g11187 [Rubroshorea leprosula]